MRLYKDNPALLVLAGACLQSTTIDEADPLNFYRRSYSNDDLPAFSGADSGKLPKGASAYVIFYSSSLDFIKDEHLK